MNQKFQNAMKKIKDFLTPQHIYMGVNGFLVVLGVVLLGAVALIIMKYIALQKKIPQLAQMRYYYDQRSKIENSKLKKDVELTKNVQDVVTLYAQTKAQIASTEQYYNSLQVPYTNFLQYFLLPQLNIWKDKFTGQISGDLLGINYLEKNKYLDVNLISEWTEFFKDIGRDSLKNKITTIDLGVISESADGLFTLPITVNFVSETKRAFLLFVDKMSLTSNKENLALMNELFYNIWQVVKEKDNPVAQTVAQNGLSSQTGTVGQAITGEQNVGGEAPSVPSVDEMPSSPLGDTAGQTTSGGLTATNTNVPLTDAEIGKKLYDWVYDDKSTFLSEKDIIAAVRRTSGCEDTDQENVCYFRFREKYRSIPMIAYTIGLDSSNKVFELRSLIKIIPPLISVNSFIFKKQSAVEAVQNNGVRGFQGSLTINVYGRAISEQEVGDISQYLGNICTNKVALNPDVAARQITSVIEQAESVSQITNEKSKQLSDLKNEFEKIGVQYQSKQGFQRVITLFELYRMLNENSLCNIK